MQRICGQGRTMRGVCKLHTQNKYSIPSLQCCLHNKNLVAKLYFGADFMKLTHKQSTFDEIVVKDSGIKRGGGKWAFCHEPQVMLGLNIKKNLGEMDADKVNNVNGHDLLG